MYKDGYTFVPGKDELVREGSAGYVVSFGDALYRALDAVERLRAEGVMVGEWHALFGCYGRHRRPVARSILCWHDRHRRPEWHALICCYGRHRRPHQQADSERRGRGHDAKDRQDASGTL